MPAWTHQTLGMGLYLFYHDDWERIFYKNCTIHPIPAHGNMLIGMLSITLGIFCEVGFQTSFGNEKLGALQIPKTRVSRIPKVNTLTGSSLGFLGIYDNIDFVWGGSPGCLRSQVVLAIVALELSLIFEHRTSYLIPESPQIETDL